LLDGDRGRGALANSIDEEGEGLRLVVLCWGWAE